MTWFAKDIEWLRPYFYLAKNILPNVGKITHIRKTFPKKHQITRQYGCLTKDLDTRKYSMTIYVRYRRVKTLKAHRKGIYLATCQLKQFSKIDIIQTFAHELAHVIDLDHTPRHGMMEAKLYLLFLAKLSETGYVSEEVELRRTKKDYEC